MYRDKNAWCSAYQTIHNCNCLLYYETGIQCISVSYSMSNSSPKNVVKTTHHHADRKLGEF